MSLMITTFYDIKPKQFISALCKCQTVSSYFKDVNLNVYHTEKNENIEVMTILDDTSNPL